METSNGTEATKKNSNPESRLDVVIDASSIQFENPTYKEDFLKEKILLLLKISGNNNCIECSQKDPEWASMSLGVFICIGCSGIHRNLGVHISRVRSLYLDNWKREELEFMRDNGNTKSLSVWELHLPLYFVRPLPEDSIVFKEQFIRAKYERKEFVTATSDLKKSVELPSKEGFLTKQGIVVKNWKRRWFILSGTLLFYYKKQKDPFPAGIIQLNDAKNIECLAESIDNRTCCFLIDTSSRSFYVTADSAKEMFDWVQALKSAKSQLSIVQENGKKAPQIDVKEILSKISGGISIQKRKLHKKTYPNCFIGTSAVDWMMLHLDLESRNEGVVLGNKLLQEGFIHNLTSTSFVDDSTAFYQFLKMQ